MKFLKVVLPLFLIVSMILAGCGGETAPETTAATESVSASVPAETTPVTPPDLSAPVEYSGQIPSDAIALVANGDTVTPVSSVADMSAAIASDGCTRIRLLQDIDRDKSFSLPYSCTLDLDGHKISTNPEKGTGIMIVDAGSVNGVTTLKNGQLVSNAVSLWINAGGVVLQDMHIQSLEGICLGLYDPDPAYKDINRVTGSTLISGGNGCISFNKTETDFTGAGICIDNSWLVNNDPEGGFVLNTKAASRTSGTFQLGDNVSFYSYGYWAIPSNYLYFSGKLAHKTTVDDLTIDGVSCPGIQCWSTENDQQATDMLFIGNSFCYYFVEELQGIAAANGHAVNVANLYEAGCRIDEHWDWLNNPQNKYELWITNDFGRFLVSGVKNLHQALPLFDWEKISVQQHFTPGKAKTVEAAIESCTPYAKNLFDYLKENHPAAELYWHEHWAFQVGHDTVPDVETQTWQQTNLRAASVAISEENGVTMIPGGDAWVLARADSKFGDTLCKTDNIHDGDTQGGQYLNACVWYETLFRESCIGNSWRPDYRLSEDKLLTLQDHAHDAVVAFFGADYLQ